MEIARSAIAVGRLLSIRMIYQVSLISIKGMDRTKSLRLKLSADGNVGGRASRLRPRQHRRHTEGGGLNGHHITADAAGLRAAAAGRRGARAISQDGAGEFQVFLRAILPLLLPGLASALATKADTQPCR